MTLGPRQQKLVDTLRSGKYEQGRGMLQSGTNKFCCLGVACDLAAKDGVNVGYQVGRLIGVTLSQQAPVKEYYGFADSTGGYDPECSLASKNDRGVPFPEIADIIEQNASTIFTSPM